jgi:hypothetical protein
MQRKGEQGFYALPAFCRSWRSFITLPKIEQTKQIDKVVKLHTTEGINFFSIVFAIIVV